ncbi:luciferase family protein [Miltoncostaea oceani]|uniref:luciferase domain-containing protein n=1 Tax=Miltoncostaea oceani TaxID=2843216 RepID=UPI001C3D7BAF|nr:luciferase family protein [Miltoncostaea oceani]
MTDRTATAGAAGRIAEEVARWPGVTVEPGSFGSLAFVHGRREIAHLHGDHAAHFAFPRAMRAELLAAGRVAPHPALPNSPGLAARRIDGEEDERDVIAMMRMNYDRIVARHGVVAGRT